MGDSHSNIFDKSQYTVFLGTNLAIGKNRAIIINMKENQ